MILGTNLLFIHKDLINAMNVMIQIFKIVIENNAKFTLINNLTISIKLVNKDEQ